MSEPKHTRGPWRWEVNEKSKGVQLAGGKPRYDRTVMEFVRYGMGGAAPVFQDEDGILERCEKWAEPVPGREHHKAWFKTLNHPDAHLIAAAPELLAALKDVMGWIKNWDPDLIHDPEWPATDAAAEAAIAKAEGGRP